MKRGHAAATGGTKFKQTSLSDIFKPVKSAAASAAPEKEKEENAGPPAAKRPKVDAERAIEGTALSMLMATRGQAPAAASTKRAASKKKKKANDGSPAVHEVFTLTVDEETAAAAPSSSSSSAASLVVAAAGTFLRISWSLDRGEAAPSLPSAEGDDEKPAAPALTAKSTEDHETAASASMAPSGPSAPLPTFTYGQPVPATLGDASFKKKLAAALPVPIPISVPVPVPSAAAGTAASTTAPARFPKRTIELRLRAPASIHCLLWHRQHSRSTPLTRLTKGVLQSSLQKAIRRGRSAGDVRALAAELWRRGDAVDAVKRLMIIMVEDCLLHPAAPVLAWMMLALAVPASSHSSGLGDLFEGLFLSIACDLATSSAFTDRDSSGGGKGDGGESGSSSSASGGAGEDNVEDDDSEEEQGEGASASASSSSSDAAATPSSSPSLSLPLGAVAGPGTGAASPADVLVWSLLVRAGIGASSWDIDLLITTAAKWAVRLLGSSHGGGEDDSKGSDSKRWMEGLYRWNGLAFPSPTPSHAQHHCYRLQRPFFTLESTNAITARGFCLEGMDYHCRPDLPYLLLGLPMPQQQQQHQQTSSSSSSSSSSASAGVRERFVPKPGSSGIPSVADSARFLRLFEEAAIETGAENAVAAFQTSMWHFRSGINVRPALLPAALLDLEAEKSLKRTTEAEASEAAKRERAGTWPRLLAAWEAVLPALRSFCIAELSSRLNQD